jgi:Protein of unknown function (DUF3263)
VSAPAATLGRVDEVPPIERVPRADALLGFERSWRGFGVPKARAIRERLGVSPTRYHQLLNAALDVPEVLELDPTLVLRLRRLRETRRSRRARGAGSPPRPLG